VLPRTLSHSFLLFFLSLSFLSIRRTGLFLLHRLLHGRQRTNGQVFEVEEVYSTLGSTSCCSVLFLLLLVGQDGRMQRRKTRRERKEMRQFERS
jgi:hypothetical protein